MAKAGSSLDRRDQLVGGVGERVVVGAGDRELQPLPAAADAKAVGGEGRNLDAGDRLELAVEFGGDLGLAAGPLVPRRKRGEHEAAAAAALRGGEDVGDLAAVDIRLHDLLDPAHLVGDVVDGRALRRRAPRAGSSRDPPAGSVPRAEAGRRNSEPPAKSAATSDDHRRRAEAPIEQAGIEADGGFADRDDARGQSGCGCRRIPCC